MEEVYYVYVYREPKTGDPMYFGKGREERVFDHWKYICAGKPTTNIHWTRKLTQIFEDGEEPLIEVLHKGLSSEEALSYETFYISSFGRRDYDADGVLYNQLIKGTDWTGVKHSEESRQKIGAAHRGKKLSSEHRQALVDANTGRIPTEEQRERMRIAQKGKTVSEETRRKMSESAKNRPRSEAQIESLKKIQNNLLGKKRPTQAERMKGKKHSQETIERMRQAALKRWQQRD